MLWFNTRVDSRLIGTYKGTPEAIANMVEAKTGHASTLGGWLLGCMPSSPTLFAQAWRQGLPSVRAWLLRMKVAPTAGRARSSVPLSPQSTSKVILMLESWPTRNTTRGGDDFVVHTSEGSDVSGDGSGADTALEEEDVSCDHAEPEIRKSNRQCNRGRLFEFSSTNSPMDIIHRYHNHMKAEDNVSAEVDDKEESKYASFMTMEELLQTVEKQLEEPDVDDLSIADLVQLENQVETALTQTRFTKTHLLIESIKNLHDKEKLLIEENKVLEDEIGTIKNKEANEMEMNLNNIAPTHMDCGQQRETLNFL
ncbi:hypothetical protein K7X08_006188 [Anisodus acutangulus]|uniref:K-box domain-containing protein n=1 Tax=Anisodus acutangulus TaxID=402998 RepID=A0A9Q1N0Y1_9SOLA|nr:hypothetical protein K7X08_006188 [Anisodus acutangulus]